ncbi:MAG TPA: HEAT repeat domain-containing protein [Humisphaera sp.]|nr:HEAT repeat domain-containing protein [Humisphaera sp.]
MRLPLSTLLIFLLSIAVGCGPDSDKGGQHKSFKDPKPTAQPPAPPPRQNVALDPELRAAADRELSESLKSADPILRVHALEGIRDSNSTTHQDEILKALHDPQPVVRFAAALTAGELKIAAAHDPLLAIAMDHSENVRVAVRFALHRLGDYRYSHELEHLATDASPLVRGNVAFVLGMLGESSALRILRVLRIDPDPAVRQQASEAMWRLGDEDGLKDLIGLTYSRYPDDRMIGYLGLALPGNTKIRQHVRVGLVAGWPDVSWPEVALVAARAMGMLGSDEGYAIAQQGAVNADSRQRVQAAFAFGAIGRSDAQDILRKLLADSDASVRIAAATAILQLKAG